MAINKLNSLIVKKISEIKYYNNKIDIIKKIIENSCDANSVNIKIFENNDNILAIKDDGCGIAKKDLIKISEQYNTSKIKNLRDIYNIKTYGFKGEALFFAKNILDITIISKTKDQKFGYKIHISGRKKVLEKCICNYGTTVIIKKLYLSKLDKKKLIDEIKYLSINNIRIKFKIILNKITLLFNFNNNTENNIKITFKNSFSDIKIFYCNFKNINCTIYYEMNEEKKAPFLIIFINKIRLKDKKLNKIILNELKKNLNKYSKFAIIIKVKFEELSYKQIINLDINKIENFILDTITEIIIKFINYKTKKTKKLINIKSIEKCNNCFCLDSNNINENYINESIIILLINSKNKLLLKINDSIYIIKIRNLLSKIINNNLIYQFKNNGRIEKIKVEKPLILKTKDIKYFKKIKDLCNLYGLEITDMQPNFIKVLFVPKILYTFKINWLNLFENIKNLVKSNKIYYNSNNRIELSIIHLISESICKNILIKECEINFIEKEILYIIKNDVDWFNSNFKYISI